MDQLARQLGVDEGTAEEATRAAVPALLDGMQANAADPAGSASLGAALREHDPGLVEGRVDLDRVDTKDGDKIVSNVFGPNRDQVVTKLAGGRTDSGLLGKLLPMLAPLVMSFLAKRSHDDPQGPGADGSSGLSDLLGGMLGGAGGGRGADGLGDLLGGLLGAGKR